jgi:hypothetical protein
VCASIVVPGSLLHGCYMVGTPADHLGVNSRHLGCLSAYAQLGWAVVVAWRSLRGCRLLSSLLYTELVARYILLDGALAPTVSAGCVLETE